MKKIKQTRQATAIGLIIAAGLVGCKSETLSYKGEVELAQATPHVEVPVVGVPQVDEPTVESPIVEEPIVELTPSVPVIIPPAPVPVPTPTPQLPTLPIFIGEGITTHTQQPYSGTIVKGGDAYLRYNQDATSMDKFELPEWEVEYKYEPFLEVLITNGTETLCARYSWKKGGFGYAKPHCLWSDTRQALPLTDMQAAYYGYSVIETRIWVNGVVWLGVEIKGE
ncbi:membrane lipoprotein [Vibrio phage vB_VhaS_MAG7]|nr:membrane lipoprotein [Vibrio phage vB_VhaS_MAG7]